jgi:uncharacterized protein involved in high-affinity Fe2+ transport
MKDWVWDPLSFRWEQGFKYLQQYVTENGDAFVPNRYRTADRYNLGTWIGHQRNNKGDLSQDRRERLEDLKGWVWDLLSFQWEQGFKYLQQYVAENGDAFVPARYRTPDGYNLGAWVNQLRVKKDDLSQDRRERLEAMKDWVWDPLSFRWEQGFKYLQQYVKDEGDAHVHAHHETSDGFRLGTWISRQRNNKGDLSQDRRERLEAMKDWVWDAIEFKWEQGFKYLQQYVVDEGDALVPALHKTPDGYNLGQWVSNKRRSFETISQDRKELLEALNGWVWNARK